MSSCTSEALWNVSIDMAVRRTASGSREAQCGAVGQGALAAGQRIVDGQRDERPRVLAAPCQEVVGQRFGRGDRIQSAAGPVRRSTSPAAVRLTLRGARRVKLFRFEHLGRRPHQMHVAARCRRRAAHRASGSSR